MKVAFYKATRPGLEGVFNALVRWWTKGPYSHCELILEERDGLALCGSASWLDGGVRLKWIKLNPEHWDLLPVSGDPNSLATVGRIVGAGYSENCAASTSQ